MDKLLKPIIGIFLLSVVISCADTALAISKEQLVKNGNAFFSAGKYDDAIRSYDEAAVDDPESPIIYFNKGAALYKKGDYVKAIDAYQQAAVKTKNISLEAKSKFNIGLCFFRKGERQKDNDLKKALESYEAGVQSFQETLALDPTFTEAAENIEMVRLMIKALLDEIKKQEEAAKKQQEQNQKTAEQIKQLIEKQKNLLAENQSLINDQPATETTEAPSEKAAQQSTGIHRQQIKDIEEAQNQLKSKTQDLSEQLASQVPASGAISPSASSNQGVSPAPEHPSKRYLDASAVKQHNAVERFSENKPEAAADNQQDSLDQLNAALEALKNSQQNSQEGQQQQQGDQQQGKQQKKGDEQSQKDKNEKNQNAQPSEEDSRQPDKKQQMQAMPLTDDANNIIDEEKENKKQRMPFSSGDFKNVDKDW